MDSTLVKPPRVGSTLPDIHPEDIPALRTMMSTVRRNPVAALKELSTGKAPRNVLLTIVNLCLIEARVRRLGSAKIFIQYIVDGYEVEPPTDVEVDTAQSPGSDPISPPGLPIPPGLQPKPTELSKPTSAQEPLLNAPPELLSTSGLRPWETPLRGIVNILAGMKRETSLSRLDVKVRDELRAAYQSIMTAIWRDSSSILLPGRGGDYRRSLIGRAMCMFANLDGMKQLVYFQSIHYDSD